MNYKYKTQGTCSVQIDMDIEEGLLKNVNFTGGCDGNLKVISKLVEGMKAEEVIEKCKGITCGYKDTSCGDQLAKAIKRAIEKD